MQIAITWLIFGIIIFCGCRKECHDFSSSTENCDRTDLIICDSSSDVRKYVVRTDSSHAFGIAKAIKSVKSKGEIDWVANNVVKEYNDGIFFLELSNFADTSWVGFEEWAYLRETIFIKFDPAEKGIQKIYRRSAFEADSAIHYATYLKQLSDITEAKWEIDLFYESTILVTTYDPLTQIIEGEFDLYFVLTKQSILHGVNYAPTARFKCGTFRAKIM